MTATERRRNMRAENCRGCRLWVEAGAGFLYRDTNSLRGRRTLNRTGRFGWFVKCPKCHSGETAREQRQAERQEEIAARGGKRWSVRDVSRFVVEVGQYQLTRIVKRSGLSHGYVLLPVCGEGWSSPSPCVLVRVDNETVAVAYHGIIHSNFDVQVTFYGQDKIGGRELTDKAAAALNERINSFTESVRSAIA